MSKIFFDFFRCGLLQFSPACRAFFDNNSSGFSAVLDFLFIFDHFQTNYASSNYVNCDNIAKKMQFTKFTFCDTIIA